MKGGPRARAAQSAPRSHLGGGGVSKGVTAEAGGSKDAASRGVPGQGFLVWAVTRATWWREESRNPGKARSRAQVASGVGPRKAFCGERFVYSWR